MRAWYAFVLTCAVGCGAAETAPDESSWSAATAAPNDDYAFVGTLGPTPIVLHVSRRGGVTSGYLDVLLDGAGYGRFLYLSSGVSAAFSNAGNDVDAQITAPDGTPGRLRLALRRKGTDPRANGWMIADGTFSATSGTKKLTVSAESMRKPAIVHRPRAVTAPGAPCPLRVYDVDAAGVTPEVRARLREIAPPVTPPPSAPYRCFERIESDYEQYTGYQVSYFDNGIVSGRRFLGPTDHVGEALNFDFVENREIQIADFVAEQNQAALGAWLVAGQTDYYRTTPDEDASVRSMKDVSFYILTFGKSAPSRVRFVWGRGNPTRRNDATLDYTREWKDVPGLNRSSRIRRVWETSAE